MNNEYELIRHPKLRNINILLNNICYRNYHFHNEIELLFVLAGQADIRTSAWSVHAEKGSMILINSMTPHEIDAGGDSLTTLILQVSSHFLKDYIPAFSDWIFLEPKLNDCLTTEDQSRLWSLSLDTGSSYFDAPEQFELDCAAGLIQILQILFRCVPHELETESDRQSRERARRRMAHIASFIDEHYQEPIRLTDLAEQENVTTTHLSHLFRESFGISFQEYLNNTRFEHAMTLIGNPSLSLSDVAFDSGFSDTKYLNKMFEKHFHCTPKEFRKRNKDIQYNPASKAPAPTILEYIYDDADSLRILQSLRRERNTAIGLRSRDYEVISLD